MTPPLSYHTGIKNISVFSYILLGLLFIVFIAITRNLFTPFLWYDEAVQFFVSKGLNAHANPLAHPGGLIDVIASNKFCNLDPGGFGMILYFWSKLSDHYVWLRLLPFLFFVGVVLSFIYLSYSWVNDLRIAILMGFIPILIPSVLTMGFEIRAYSMECMGTLVCVVVLEKLREKISCMRLLVCSCVLCFFMTSRYSEIIVVFIASIYVLLLICRDAVALKKKVKYITIYALPLLIMLNYIYFFALVFQNRNLEPLPYLSYLSSDKGILLRLPNLLFICVVGMLLIVYLSKGRFPLVRKYEALLFVSIYVNVLFLVLSFLGKHPWDPISTRCISLFLLVILCVSAVIGELLKPLFNSNEITKYYFIVFVLLLTLNHRKKFLYVREDLDNTYCNFLKYDVSGCSRVYIDYWANPSVRYLLEYGSFRNERKYHYPDRFVFGMPNQSPRMNDLLDYDLLIAPELYKGGYNDKWRLVMGTTNFYVKF